MSARSQADFNFYSHTLFVVSLFYFRRFSFSLVLDVHGNEIKSGVAVKKMKKKKKR